MTTTAEILKQIEELKTKQMDLEWKYKTNPRNRKRVSLSLRRKLELERLNMIKKQKLEDLKKYDFSECGEFTPFELKLYMNTPWYTIKKMLDNRQEAINNDLHLKSTRTVYDPPIMFDDVIEKPDEDIFKMSEYDYFEKSDSDDDEMFDIIE
mgnify:CR=1 FL=1